MMIKTKSILFTILFVLIATSNVTANAFDYCPKISVSDPPVAASPGENMVFSVISKSDLEGSKYSFVWKVDQGSIAEGQGTQAITVNTSGLEKTLIVATLQIVGLPRKCQSVYSATGNVKAPIPICDNFGFGEIPENDVRARLDAAFADLQSTPSKILYIVTEGRKEQIDKLHNLIKAYAKTFAAEFDLDTSRISYISNYYDQEILTRFWFSCENDEECCYRPKSEVKSCPSSISVLDPPVAVAPGENLTFTAQVIGEFDRESIGYKWVIDEGRIIKGQGTETITVSTKGLSDTTVNATVLITGLPENCLNSASGSSSTICYAQSIFKDEFGVLSTTNLKKRIESYLKDLNADPTAKGYIVNYGDPKDVKKRETSIRNLPEIREGYDSQRIVFVNGGEEKTIRTRLWIVPAGADASQVN